MALVVSDTSPIRALGHLACLPWLEELFAGVVLPPSVADELAHPPAGLPAVDVAEWTFIAVRAPQRAKRVAELEASLDIGEWKRSPWPKRSTPTPS
jgi:predicted nucleic acid-binding protein